MLRCRPRATENKTALSVIKHDFTAPGMVSLWATTRPIAGVHHDFLEGCDQLFMWLLIDYEAAINGAFTTNFTSDGNTVPLAELLTDLHASESFAAAATLRGEERDVGAASFVLALYDYAYDPVEVGLPPDERGSDWLAFVGAFPFRE